MMTKAKTKEEFEEAWKEHFNNLSSLASSLPSGSVALNYLAKVKNLKEYIKIASRHVYGGQENAT